MTNEELQTKHLECDLPTNKQEAKAMQAIGFAWLQQHAPEELK